MKQLVLLLSLVLGSPAQAAGFWRACLDGFTHFGRRPDPFLAEHQVHARLRAWAEDLARRDGKPTYLEEHAPLLLEGLSASDQAVLLAPGRGGLLSEQEMMQRLSALDLVGSPLERPLTLLARSSSSHRESALDRLAILRRQMTPAERVAIEAEILRRGQLARAEARLQIPENYVAKVAGDELVFPDGPRLKILGREANGSLILEVEIGRVLPGQDRIDQAKVMEYAGSKWIDDEIFWGELTPDGRFKIVDQHHRITAYARKHGGRIRVRAHPNAEGGVAVTSHFDVLKFYTLWSQLPSERQLQVLEQAASGNPLDAIRPVYYELLRLPQPPR